jgi:hypothetical protein
MAEMIVCIGYGLIMFCCPVNMTQIDHLLLP